MTKIDTLLAASTRRIDQQIDDILRAIEDVKAVNRDLYLALSASTRFLSRELADLKASVITPSTGEIDDPEEAEAVIALTDRIAANDAVMAKARGDLP